ncbi:M28 family peptidase [Geothrix sp. PMB-07]|uniref:M28 family peptidase n=1 Tax=Geothrix sp. PMB-07 TaxID=3068640 RepID=UPI002740B6DF|nr:M28 family peptidase [Geothrix sp. PMB-07]WLT31036.1 M28 family peptidase [Geothrix sp. PMB-07]
MRPVICAALMGMALWAQGPKVDESALRAHLAFLADDVLEGRGTGQRGGELAVRYLETQLQVLGLAPANGPSYRQTVKLSGMRLQEEGSGLRFEGLKGTLAPTLGSELVLGAAAAETSLAVDAPLVFVGHGIAASDGSRDDYKGVDVKGRILVMLVGDRHSGPPMPLCCQPENFYGRWTYKFEEARRRGAAGALLVHTDASAGYGWPVVRNGWTQERFQREGSGQPGAVQGWITEATAIKLFALGGQDFKALAQGADAMTFQPVVLPIQAKGQVRSTVRSLEQWNVAGFLPGKHPDLRKEVVIYSAHWDHFGKGADGAIYAGAVDNATGCAAVLALAQTLVHEPLERSVMFFFPCAEEQGLIGSSAYVAAPLWPLERTVLDINLESLNVVGPTRDIGLLGSSEPRMRALCAQAAAATGLVITPAKADPAGLCFRSDHFPFAKAGVPALSPGFSLDGGWDYLGDKAAAQAKASDFLNHYHRPTDRYHPEWNLEGLMQQVRFALELGRLAGTVPNPR